MIQPEPLTGGMDRLKTVLFLPRARWITYPFIMLFLLSNTINFGFAYFYTLLFKENDFNFGPGGDLLFEALLGGIPSLAVTFGALMLLLGNELAIGLLSDGVQVRRAIAEVPARV